MSETTAIRVSKDTWRRLSALKSDPGQSFDDIVTELLDEADPDELPIDPPV